MVKIKLKKRGFTLVEILISLVILTLFFAAATKILTVKPKRQYQNSVHGYYECYYEDGVLKYHDVYEAYNPNPKDANSDHCTFTPSRNVAFYNLIVVYPTASGGGAYTDIQPSINNELHIYPNELKIANADEDADVYDPEIQVPVLSETDLQVYLDTTVQNCKIVDIVKKETHEGAIMISW